MEKIKNIPFAKEYQVNSTGEVIKNGKILKSSIRKDGYLQISIIVNGRSKTIAVHRLVAETFIDNPLNKRTVNHINGEKTDNRIENLEWNTDSENIKHSYRRLGRINASFGRKGGNSYRARKIVQLTKKNEFIKTWECIVDAGETLGINQGNISSSCTGRCKSAGGFIWKYL